VLEARNGLATDTGLRRRINFYPFLLNDFKQELKARGSSTEPPERGPPQTREGPQ
jgi:hypothetical protein